jgi:RNA polymerase sigma-70 factor, ECF subfamily
MTVHSVDPTDRVPNSRADADELNQWISEYRDRLRSMVQVRLTPRMAARIDASDVIQEAFVEATERFADYRRNPTLTPYLWLRFLTLQRLKILYRRHLGTHMRTADREIVMPELEVSSIVLAKWLVDSGTSPSNSAMKQEQGSLLREAVERLSPQDREVLALRHFEQLSNEEAAHVLGLALAATRQRYYRALERLRELLLPILGDSSLSAADGSSGTSAS